jgi:hypothetical protein
VEYIVEIICEKEENNTRHTFSYFLVALAENKFEVEKIANKFIVDFKIKDTTTVLRLAIEPLEESVPTDSKININVIGYN